MNIYEASKNFERIRRKSWTKDHNIRVGLNTEFYILDILHDDRYSLCLAHLMADDWEEYKEPRKYLTTKEAMQALIEGHMLKSDGYDEDQFTYLSNDGNLIFNDGRDSHPCFTRNKSFYIYEGEK